MHNPLIYPVIMQEPTHAGRVGLRSMPIHEGIMPQCRYFVVRNQDDEWVIKFEDEEYGPYQSQSEALMFAIEAAQKLGRRGGNPEVCLMGVNGHFRPEWAYGRDAYPPRL